MAEVDYVTEAIEWCRCVSVHQDLLDAVDTNVPTTGFGCQNKLVWELMNNLSTR